MNKKGWIAGLLIAFALITGFAACGGDGGSNAAVLETVPADKAVGVDYFQAITMKFAVDLNESAITSDNIKLTRANGTINVPGAITYDLAARSITFTPTFPMVAGAPYEFSVNSIVYDASGGKAETSTGVNTTFTTQVRPIVYTYNEIVDPAHPAISISNIMGMYEDGTGLVNYTNNTSDSSAVRYDGVRFNSVSPGYQYLAYRVENVVTDPILGPSWYTDLWIMNADGTGKTKITSGSYDNTTHIGSMLPEIKWALDGSGLYYAWANAGEANMAKNIFFTTPDGTISPVTQYSPDGNGIQCLDMSRDGTRLSHLYIEGIYNDDANDQYIRVSELDSTGYAGHNIGLVASKTDWAS